MTEYDQLASHLIDTPSLLSGREVFEFRAFIATVLAKGKHTHPNNPGKPVEVLATLETFAPFFPQSHIIITPGQTI